MAREDQCPSLETGKESEFSLTVFCSIEAFNGLDEGHPHQGGQSSLLGLPIHMLISPQNTLTDTPRIMFN